MLGNAFKEKSLETRMMFAFITMGGMVLAVTLIGLNSVIRLSSNIDAINGNSLPSQVGLWKVSQGQTQIESSERILMVPNLSLSERQAEEARINKAREQIKDGFKQYESTPRTDIEDADYKKLQESWDKWKKDDEEFLKLNQQFESLGILNPRGREIELLRQGKDKSPEMEKAQKAENLLNQFISRALENRTSFESVSQLLVEIIKINEDGGIAADKDANQNINQSKYWAIITIIFAPLAAILFGRYFSNKVAKPLDALIRNVGIQITTSTTQIAASGKELEATVAQQIASTNEVTCTSQEIATTSKSLVKTMEQVAEMTQATATAANKSQGELAQMETVMRNLAEATNSISSKLGVMNKKAANINNVVVTITKVADQTSILSLNAAIEAEKAGEYGAGFAVVAREIRRLANQTAVATLEIEQIVKDIQSSVSAGVMEMDKFNKSVSDSVERIDKISGQVAAVIQQVQSLPPQFSQVTQTVEEQSQGAQKISESMQQLSEASHQTADALRGTNDALETLNDAAEGLRTELSRFK